MEYLWFYVWLLIALVAVAQLSLTSTQVFESCRFASSRIKKRHLAQSDARVRLFAPCKGLDVGLEANLQALFKQDHPNYELVFVVDSATDPAAEVIRRLIERHAAVNAQILVAGEATDGGQKVHNLREATREIPPEVEILAFVDSDARPAPGWLTALVHRLDRPETAATTGYRWFVPQRTTVANCLLYSVNAFLASLMGPGNHYLVWGGSWAIRRQIFDEIGLWSAWQGTLSDDLVASQVLHSAGYPVEFEPNCVVASPVQNTSAQVFEFLRRQYVIGRFYATKWWAIAVLLSTASVIAFWGGLLISVIGIYQHAWWGYVAAAMTGVQYGISVLRAIWRCDLMQIVLPESSRPARSVLRFDCLSGPWASLVNWTGLLSSLWGSTIKWRGIHYRIYGGGRARILGRSSATNSNGSKWPASPYMAKQRALKAARIR